jgi:hypothetical protein
LGLVVAGGASIVLTASRYTPPDLATVRQALGRIRDPAEVRRDRDVHGIRVFRGRVSSRGVSVHFVLLAGDGAWKLTTPSNQVLVAGRRTTGAVGLDNGEGHLVLLDDSERFEKPTPQRRHAYDASFAVEDAFGSLD